MPADALAIVQAIREQGRAAADAPEIIDMQSVRPATRRPIAGTSVGSVDLSDLAISPADPRFKDKIQPPEKSILDDVPPTQTVVEVPIATAVPTQPQSVSTKRLGIYCGRGEGNFVVAIEEAPDWDSEESIKMDAPTTRMVARVVKALGIKVSDKTGGELVVAGLEENA